jgi:hypothetical protein
MRGLSARSSPHKRSPPAHSIGPVSPGRVNTLHPSVCIPAEFPRRRTRFRSTCRELTRRESGGDCRSGCWLSPRRLALSWRIRLTACRSHQSSRGLVGGLLPWVAPWPRPLQCLPWHKHSRRGRLDFDPDEPRQQLRHVNRLAEQTAPLPGRARQAGIRPFAGHEGEVRRDTALGEQRFDEIEALGFGHLQIGEEEIRTGDAWAAGALADRVEGTEAGVGEGEDLVAPAA